MPPRPARRTPRRLAPTLTLAFAATIAAMFVPAHDHGAAWADEITMKSGKSFTGRIIREDEGSFTIDTDDFGPTKITKSDIVKVQRGTGPAVEIGKTPAAGTSKEGAPAAPQAPAVGGPQTPTGAANKQASGAAPPNGPGAKSDPKAKPAPADEPLDAEARLEARRGMTITRVTQAAGASTTATPATSQAGPTAEKTTRAESDRQAIGGAQLAGTATGTTVLIYEPPHAVTFAPAGVAIGRRTIARLDTVGRGTARLAVIVGGKEDTWTLRLADVQRLVVVKAPTDRVRLLEGLDTGDWVRVRTDDGVVHEGRLSELSGSRVRLLSTATDGTPLTAEVDIATAVQLDGLAKSSSTTRTLQELESHDPIAVTLWPTGRQVVGRVTDATGAAVKVDVDRDGAPDELVAFDSPVADVQRIAAKWRDLARDLGADSAVRVRNTEDYPDARVEREWTGMVAGITAYAICVKTPDGAAVVPFDSVLKLDHISAVHAQPERPLAAAVLNLPVNPGDARDALSSLANAKGVSALNDGSVVTHVWVTAPWDAPVAGIRIDQTVEDALASSQLRFTTEIRPRDARTKAPARDAAAKDTTGPRELISESVEGTRVMVQIDATGRVRLIEIARK